MKYLLITGILFSINASASFDCASTDHPDYRVIAISRIRSASTVTVQRNGRIIYHKAVVETPAQGGVSFTSPSFTNKNDAPASLFVNIYQSGNRIFGRFSESSYIPVVPYLQLSCQPI